jgi:hypothetical protein
MAIMGPLSTVRARGIPVDENMRSSPEDVATATQPSPTATARADSPELRLTVNVCKKPRDRLYKVIRLIELLRRGR